MAADVTWKSMNILNLSGRELQKVEVVPDISPVALILDNNNISRIENLQYYKGLQQLSVAHNRVSHLQGLFHARQLIVLNVPHNKILSIAGLKDLKLLTWLNLSGNAIKNYDEVNQCSLLEHLDLSDNHIQHLSNVSSLSKLKTLLLHGNAIETLKPAPQYLNDNITILSLAENNIKDLNEVGYLCGLSNLEQLSVMKNPCVLKTDLILAFDYRPFVINWCLNLRILDGYIITEKEGLKAEWLYSQGRGRHFKPGQHAQLIEYLAQSCPPTDSVKGSVDDAKLSRILVQQRVLQGSVDEEGISDRLQVDLRVPFVHYAEQNNAQPTQQPLQQDDTGTGESADVMIRQGLVEIQHHMKFPSTAGPAGRASTVEAHDRPSSAPSHRAVNTNKAYKSTSYLSDLHSTASEEPSSMLEAESRYLPVPSDMSLSPVRPFSLDFTAKRPSTAPPSSDENAKGEPPPRASYADAYSHRNDRVGSASEANSNGISKYDMLENRKILPQKQPVLNAFPSSPKMSPKAGSVGMIPTPSESHPQPYTRKRSQSPVTKAINFTTTEDSDSEAAKTQTTELKYLKSLLARGRTPQTESSTNKRVEGSHQPVLVSAGNAGGHKNYSPDKYSTPSRGKPAVASHQATTGVVKGGSESKAEEAETAEKKASDRETWAAVCIQAAWRGYSARTQSATVMKARHRLQAGQAEHSISSLKTEVERQKQMYEQEKNLRNVQLDALNYLWKEVKVLQGWKAEMLQSIEQESGSGKQVTDVSHTSSASVQTSQDFTAKVNQEMTHTLVRASLHKEEGFDLTPIGSESSPHPTLNSLLLRKHSSHPGQAPSSQTGGGAGPLSSSISSSTVQASQKEQQLEDMCRNLQGQVSELQEVLKSMSNYVFQGGIISADKEETGEDPVRVSLNFEDAKKDLATSHKAVNMSPTSTLSSATTTVTSTNTAVTDQTPTQPHHSQQQQSPTSTSTTVSTKYTTSRPSSSRKSSPSSHSSSRETSPRVSSSTSSSATKVKPPPGIPTAPSNLRMQEHGSTRVILQWQPSFMYNSNGKKTSKPLLGYRIYVNKKVKGMVAGTQTRALLEGLQSKAPYRIVVKAVSGLGESAESNAVFVHPESVEENSRTSTSNLRDGSEDERSKAGNSSRRNSSERSELSTSKRRHSSGSGSPRRHSKDNINPGGAGKELPPESPPQAASSSSQKTRASMHVQFDVTPDSGVGFIDTSSPQAGTNKERYCKTYPPTPNLAAAVETNMHKSVDPEQFGEKKSKRVPVSDRLKSSSVDYMESPGEHVLSSSPKEGFKKLERAIEGGQISKEDLMKFAFEKGLFSKDDIMKLVSKPHKRKSTDMLSSPLKAFSTEEMGFENESSRKHSPSRIPILTGKSKHFDSSSDSVDLPDIKESLQEQHSTTELSGADTKSGTKSSTKNSLRKSASLKQSSSEHRKHLDSSESEASPQVSPCNTSSGMSLSGTTGSDSGSDLGKKKNAKRESQHRRHHSTSSLKDLQAIKKQEQVAKICLTKPNPPPIPPPSEKVIVPLKADHSESVVKDSYKLDSGKNSDSKIKSAKASLSATPTSEEFVLSKNSNSSAASAARLSTDTYVLDKSELADIHKSTQGSLLGKSPSSQSLHSFEHDYPLTRSPERSPKTKGAHGYKPSFFEDSNSSTSPSRKIFLRREGSFGQMSDPGDAFHDAGAMADPFLVSDNPAQVQKIVQSDGTVTYASYRKVSFDRASDADMESLDGSQTISIPGLAQDEDQQKPPPSPQTLRKGSTCIDSDDASDDRLQSGRKGRSSQRSSRKRSKERRKDKGEKRASSVGALMRKLSIKRERDKEKERSKDIVAEKPPKPPTPPTGRSPSRDVETEHKTHKSERRRTKSETIGYPSDSDDPGGDAGGRGARRPPRPRSRSSGRGSGRHHRHRDSSSERGSSGKLMSTSDMSSEGEMGATSSKGGSSPSAQKKHMFGKHKRSGSDLSNITVLPDRPESPVPSPRRPAPPTTPKHGMSSPRIRRSSSFSKAVTSSNEASDSVPQKSSQALVRQCISLETLKAVKSKSQEMMNQAGLDKMEVNENDLRVSDLEDESDEFSSSAKHVVHRTVSTEVIHDPTPTLLQEQMTEEASNPLRRSGSLRDDRLLYMSKYKNEFGGDSQRRHVKDYHVTHGYSPRLSGRDTAKDDMEPPRRIKLGNKAADLFSKLTMKLSTGKN